MVDHQSRLAAILRDQESRILADWTGRSRRRPAAARPRGDGRAGAHVRPTAGPRDGAGRDRRDRGPRVGEDARHADAASPPRGRARAPRRPRPRPSSSRSRSPSSPACARSTAATAKALPRESWTATLLLDKLGLFTTEAYQSTREDIIARQQHELLELSTPVVALWEGILAVPLIGTLDSERTQVVMENLLQRIVDTGRLDRDHRHHRRADGRHAGGPAPPQDGGGGPPDGRGVHHQRDPSPDRPDHRPPRRRPRQRRHQGDPRRRARSWPSGASAPP